MQALHKKPEDKLSQSILRNHFEQLQKLDWKGIQKATGAEWPAIQESLVFIRSLEPYPARLYNPAKASYITPDVIVHKVGEDFRAMLYQDLGPSVSINQDYKKLLEQLLGAAPAQSKERAYLKEKMDAACALIDSIKRRQLSLLKISQEIIQAQREFFIKGPAKLQALVLRDLSEKLKLHESTISRAIAHKYMQTPWGYFPFKYFFSQKIKDTEKQASPSQSTRSAQERVRALITNEDVQNPLSDQALLLLLEKEDIQLARRTIAKYRKMMSIPAVEQRRKIYSFENKLKENAPSKA